MTNAELIGKHKETCQTCQQAYSWTLCSTIRKELDK